MEKVNLIVKCCLINKKYEYNIKGILKDNKLIFFLENNKMILYHNNILKRETIEEEILFDFKKEICQIKDKKTKKNIDFPIKVKKLINNNNTFEVLYQILDDKFKIEIIVR